MGYARSDSSGTDDDFLPPHVNRMPPQMGRNGRADALLMYERSKADVDLQIHKMEQDAYSAVLRAFIAQSDSFSWDKERLISNLRKELRVSDMQHREHLGKVNSDDILRQIREYRQGSFDQPYSMSNSAHPHLDSHAPIVAAPGKRKKGATSMSSLPPPMSSRVHSLPDVAAKGESCHGLGSRFPKQRFQRENWNEMGDHEEFPPGEADYAEHGGQHLMSANGRVHSNGQKSSVYANSQKHMISKKPVDLELRETSKLLKKVEQVFANGHPDPIEAEKVKAALKDHENALVDAIAKLNEISDEDIPKAAHPSNAKKVKILGSKKGNRNQNYGGYRRGVAMMDGAPFHAPHDSDEDD